MSAAPFDRPFAEAAVRGVLPAGLAGTLYVNGPGITTPARARDPRFLHQGSIVAVRFSRDGVTAARALVTTPSWEKECGRETPFFRTFDDAGSWRSVFSRGGWHPANAAIFARAGRLFAIGPTGPAIEVRPDDLSTVGPCDFDDLGIVAFAAPPVWSAARATSYAVVRQRGRRGLALIAMPDGRPAYRLATIEDASFSMSVALAVTPHFAIVVCSSVSVDGGWPGPAWRSIRSCFRRQLHAETRCVVVPIDAPKRASTLSTRTTNIVNMGHIVWHVARAVEVSASRVDLRVSMQNSLRSLGWLGGRSMQGAGRPRWGSSSATMRLRFRRPTIDIKPSTALPMAAPTSSLDGDAIIGPGWENGRWHYDSPSAILVARCDGSGVFATTLPGARVRSTTLIDRGPARGHVIALVDMASGGEAWIVDPNGRSSEPTARIALPWRVGSRAGGLWRPSDAI